MNDALSKAARDAVEAADQAEQLKLIAALVQAQQLLAAQQPACQHPAPRREFDTKKWVTIGGLVVAGGLTASLFAIAAAIGAVSVAILALVLRSMWADYQKGR